MREYKTPKLLGPDKDGARADLWRIWAIQHLRKHEDPDFMSDSTLRDSLGLRLMATGDHWWWRKLAQSAALVAALAIPWVGIYFIGEWLGNRDRIACEQRKCTTGKPIYIPPSCLCAVTATADTR